MTKRRRIYCIEGEYDKGRDPQTTVRPFLEALENGYWPNLIYRYCTNYETLQEQLREFEKYCDYGSILYLATHGHEGSLKFSKRLEICIEQLGLMLWYGACSGCIVHFSSCLTLNRDRNVLDAFLKDTETLAISGYDRDVGWFSETRPAMQADLAYLTGLSSHDGNVAPNLTRWNPEDVRRYSNLCRRVQSTYGDCGFTACTSKPQQ